MATSKKTTTARERFIDYLHLCGMRVTSERLSIIDVITKHPRLFSIDELHGLMSKEAFPVSTATLYNTIELLIDAGLVKCLRLPDRPTGLYRLDLDNSPRIYLVCELCGAIKEKPSKTLTKYISKYDFTAFTPESFTLTVSGMCQRCIKRTRRGTKGKKS